MHRGVLVFGVAALVFAVTSIVFTPLDGAVLAIFLGFGFGAYLRYRDIEW